jgi:hypothetical protein
MFEEAEVCILPCELMRKVRKLCDLKEIFLFHLALIEPSLDDLASTQEYSILFDLINVFHKTSLEPWVLVLHLMPKLIPQSNLLPMHKGKDHVQSVQELIKRHLFKIFGGNCTYVFQECLLA